MKRFVEPWGGGGERKEGEHKRGGRLLNARLNKALQEL